MKAANTQFYTLCESAIYLYDITYTEFFLSTGQEPRGQEPRASLVQRQEMLIQPPSTTPSEGVNEALARRTTYYINKSSANFLKNIDSYKY